MGRGPLARAPGKADRVGWRAVRDQGRDEVGGVRGADVLGRLPQLGDGPPAVPGDDGTLQLLVTVGADLRVRDPDQEVRVSAEDKAAAAGPPQAAARGHDGAEVLLGDHVAGLLGELADGCRLDGLASVQPAAGRQPRDAAVPAAEAEQQQSVEGIKHEQPGGRPPAGGWGHGNDATGGLMPENRQVTQQQRKPSQPEPGAFRSGFACLTGRPNVGKSTLTNALVGAKVAITSDRPQTTRRAIRGIVHRPDAQLIIVDTPGLHRPRTLLGERLDSLVRSTLTEVDVIGFCVPAIDPIGPGDKYLARELENVKSTPVVAIVTKTDEAPPERIAEQLLAVSQLGDWADIVPVSAVGGYQLSDLADVLVSYLPEGPPLYPDGELTDEPELIMVAELIREAALDGVRDELRTRSPSSSRRWGRARAGTI